MAGCALACWGDSGSTTGWPASKSDGASSKTVQRLSVEEALVLTWEDMLSEAAKALLGGWLAGTLTPPDDVAAFRETDLSGRSFDG